MGEFAVSLCISEESAAEEAQRPFASFSLPYPATAASGATGSKAKSEITAEPSASRDVSAHLSGTGGEIAIAAREDDS